MSTGKGQKAGRDTPAKKSDKPKTPRCTTCVEAQGIIKGTYPESWGKTVGWARDHIDSCATDYAAQLRKKMRAKAPTIHFVDKKGR